MLSFFECWFIFVYVCVAAESTAVGESESAATLQRVKRQAHWLKLTYDQRLAFAQKHNEYRKIVDPPATDMMFLVRII